MKPHLLLIPLTASLASCAANPVSDVDAIFASPSCQQLRQRCPTARIIVREDGADETGLMEYYLGTDEDDHTCRVATLRVKGSKVEREAMDAEGELKSMAGQ